MANKPLPLFESVAAVFGIAVVAILVALPSSGTNEQEAQERVLRDHLGQVRAAVRSLVESGQEVPTTTEDLQQVLLAQYLTEIPPNPINGQATIRVNHSGFSEPRPNGTAGWLYVPIEQRVMPDLPNRDHSGRPFAAY